MIIRGNTVGTTALRADWNQTDEGKSNYIFGREAVQTAIDAVQQQAAQHSANLENPHGVTLQQLGAAAENHSHSIEEIGAVTENQVRAIVEETLGVIEHGTY